MIDIISAIGTIFALILLGSYLRLKSVPSEEYWLYADKLVYWILFPAFLFYKTSTISISSEILPQISSPLLSGLLFTVMIIWIASNRLKFDNKAGSSIVQAAGRHNTFIALAISERLFGESGLLIATLATAVLIPVTNISIVIALVIILNKGQQNLFTKIINDLIRNPLLIAIFSGFMFNYLGWTNVVIIHDVSALLGSATLPVVLLCIGASMRFQGLKQTMPALLLSSLGKFIIFPVIVLLALLLITTPPEIAIILIIYAAVPTAASGFALARQMGGDYKLMASLITNQTLISFFTLPLTIYMATKFFGLEIG
ncbi:MAG: AEC family transporter [Thiotrichaceae bacterium]|nr:AEC family transporter [Thiotrichaceae bacterium]